MSATSSCDAIVREALDVSMSCVDGRAIVDLASLRPIATPYRVDTGLGPSRGRHGLDPVAALRNHAAPVALLDPPRQFDETGRAALAIKVIQLCTGRVPVSTDVIRDLVEVLRSGYEVRDAPLGASTSCGDVNLGAWILLPLVESGAVTVTRSPYDTLALLNGPWVASAALLGALDVLALLRSEWQAGAVGWLRATLPSGAATDVQRLWDARALERLPQEQPRARLDLHVDLQDLPVSQRLTPQVLQEVDTRTSVALTAVRTATELSPGSPELFDTEVVSTDGFCSLEVDAAARAIHHVVQLMATTCAARIRSYATAATRTTTVEVDGYPSVAQLVKTALISTSLVRSMPAPAAITTAGADTEDVALMTVAGLASTHEAFDTLGSILRLERVLLEAVERSTET